MSYDNLLNQSLESVDRSEKTLYRAKGLLERIQKQLPKLKDQLMLKKLKGLPKSYLTHKAIVKEANQSCGRVMVLVDNLLTIVNDSYSHAKECRQELENMQGAYFAQEGLLQDRNHPRYSAYLKSGNDVNSTLLELDRFCARLYNPNNGRKVGQGDGWLEALEGLLWVVGDRFQDVYTERSKSHELALTLHNHKMWLLTLVEELNLELLPKCVSCHRIIVGDGPSVLQLDKATAYARLLPEKSSATLENDPCLQTPEALQSSVQKAIASLFELVMALKDSVALVSLDLKGLEAELPRLVGEAVCDRIVGQSYYNWDSTCQYFPTVTFSFVQTNTDVYRKRSQIQVRLAKNNVNMTDNDVLALRRKADLLEQLSYLYGTCRVNYVSRDKRFKSTIYCAKDSMGFDLLTKICYYIGEVYDPRFTSVTTGRSKIIPTRREFSLAGVPANDGLSASPPLMTLNRIVLMINGLNSPITLKTYN